MAAEMAKPSMAAIVSIVALLVLGASTMAVASDADVNIFNEVGSPISLHCASGDTNLGEHVLANGGKYGWGFTPNMWGSTLFHCEFAWGVRTQGFVVWKMQTRKDFFPCVHCEYHVRPDGFYVNEAGKTAPVFASPWK